MTLPKLNPAAWGFVTPYSDFAISQDPVDHIQKFKNHFFWGTIASYTGGLNPLFDNIQREIFGKDYAAAAERAGTFPSGARVELHPGLKARFGLEDYYGSGTTYVGKAELDYIFGAMEAIKAAVEYLSVYDWNIDLRNWLITEIMPTDGFDELLQKMLALTSSVRENLWRDYSTVIKMLPFRNNFLRVKNASAMPRAKSNLAQALTRMNASLSHWYDANNGSGSSSWSSTATSKNNWLKNGIAQAKTAIESNGIFYFPDKIPDTLVGSEWVWPSPGWDWPDSATSDTVDVKIYSVDLAKFFNPGIFTLQNVFMTEMGGEAPELWQIEWYQDSAAGYVTVYTGNKTLVTGPIERRGRQDNVSGTDYAPYGRFS